MPAHGIVATKMMERDIMLTPKHGERIGYLVIQGNNEKARVKDLVISV